MSFGGYEEALANITSFEWKNVNKHNSSLAVG